MKKIFFLVLPALLLLALFGCSSSSDDGDSQPILSATGHIETVDNVVNQTIVSKDDNDFKAEYEAGFLMGKQQGSLIVSTRDNNWDDAYLTDPSHSFPKQIPPSQDELSLTQSILSQNYSYTINYIKAEQDPVLAKNMKRLIFRMLGIYHGATMSEPAALDFSGNWLPELSYFNTSELTLGYETSGLSFMDVYYINAYCDVLDVISYNYLGESRNKQSKCSAFVKKTSDDIYLTHNSWLGFLDQSMAVNLYVNDTFMTYNAVSPGLIGSNTDFGYNKNGIMFNETTHRNSYNQPKTEALWMFFRAALAEQFATSLDDFYRYLSLEASGTYCNGYMIADVKTGEIGLVEMSYKNFVYFKSNGNGGYDIETKPDGISKLYDTEMVQNNFIMGINYPASYQIREDLQSTDNRPARKVQFLAGFGSVNDIETSKSLITYTDPANPLSIFGRWDLGYGETSYPKTVPDGSGDAKAISASMVKNVMNLEGIFDLESTNKSFWMKFGSAYVDGKPFIWSESQWNTQKLRNVPDRIDGNFQELNMYIR